ncbi:MAG: VapE domain-containing protein [Cyanobacteria bacterium P01_A01_bin.84]
MTVDNQAQSTTTSTKKKRERVLSEWELIDRSRNTTRLEGTVIEVFVEQELKDDLRYNILTNDFELKGKVFNIKLCQSEIYEHYNVDCSKIRLTDVITKWCLRNKFNPIREYLLSTSENVDPLDSISNLATRYFGNDDPLDNALIMKWLLATAARGLYPGTKFDGALILTGIKDAGKTSFFQEISRGWYTADVTSISGDKDANLLASSKWIVVLDEIEKIIRKASRQDIKSWVTKTRDDFRVPYDRTPQSFPRMFTIAGTCNDDDFLVEAEDNRRFWIIEIQKKIRFDVFIPEIDAMWSACVSFINEYLKQNRELESEEALRRLCELSEAEKQQLKNRSKRFAMTTGWDDVVEEFIKDNPRGYYWHTEIEEYARERNTFPAGSNPQLKIKDALKRLGYEQYKNPVTREYKDKKYKKRWWYLSHPEVVSSSDNANQEAMMEALNAEAAKHGAQMEPELQEMQEFQQALAIEEQEQLDAYLESQRELAEAWDSFTERDLSSIEEMTKFVNLIKGE